MSMDALFAVGTIGVFSVGIACLTLSAITRHLRTALESLAVMGSWQMTFVVTRAATQAELIGRETSMLIGGLGAWACFVILAQIAGTEWAYNRAILKGEER